MRIYPAVHYTMGGLWVDYDLMTTVAGLFCLGEANFSDHGANRLGASALMQGLADGYFVVPATLGAAPILVTALAGVAAMVVAGCITMQEAYEAVDWSVIFLLAGVIPQDRFYRWAAYLFFNLLWLLALFLPFFAWFFQEEFLALSVPFASVVAVGGLAAIFSIRQSRPDWTLYSTALTVLIAMVYAAVWIFPRADAYKSPKDFSLEVKNKIPATEPLYIYADTMNDFNFYTEREVIPVLSSESEVENVAAQGSTVHLLIRDRDLKRMDLDKAGEIVGSGQVGGKRWYLLRLNRQDRG